MQSESALDQKNLVSLVQIWEEDLEEVPTDLIYKSFAEARKKNTQRKIVSPAMVLEAYNFLKNFIPDAQRGAQGGYFGPRGEKIPNGTFYTIHRAETWQLLPRENELLDKWKNSQLEEADFLDWEQLTKKKFYYPKGLLQKPFESWSSEEFKKFYGRYENGNS